MRVVAIGDVGVVNDMIHIGDEAMFQALVTQLRVRDIDEVIAVSANPTDTSKRYAVEAIAPIGFSAVRGGDRLTSERRMRDVVATARGSRGLLGGDDPAHAVIDAIRSSDALVVAGGGNLSSLWPMHVFERAALGEISRKFDKPIVVTGQTVGPHLDPADSALVSSLFGGASLVGVRESSSLAKCQALGLASTAVRLNADDASFLIADSSAPQPYCAVTLASHTGELGRRVFIERVAELLDAVVAHTGLSIRFIAHFSSTDPAYSRGDTAMHESVAAAMASPTQSSITVDTENCVRIARSASLVVSSRYHPIVFAVPNGVPAIGLSVDDYTHTKLSGALANFAQSSVLAGSDLLSGHSTDLARDVWDSRDRIRADSLAAASAALVKSTQWWDDVAAALIRR